MRTAAARLQQDDLESSAAVATLLRRGGNAIPIDHLAWYPVGVGYYPVAAGIAPYDEAYFRRFARQANSEIGRRLMDARIAFVARHYEGSLLDVGIGSGAFIDRRPEFTCGYDVNPAGIKWLRERKLFADPYLVCYPLSLWDVLEHIPNFIPLLDNCREWLFLSLPIFCHPECALKSKHFRPDEHCWYFTRDGLEWTMSRLGFRLVECNDEETKIGREDILSFAFQKMK